MSKKHKRHGQHLQHEHHENNEWKEDEDIKDMPRIEEEKPKEVIDTKLEGEKVIVFNKMDQVYEPGFYGKELGDRLELSLVEACLLLKRVRIKVFKDENVELQDTSAADKAISIHNEKEMSFQELYEHACSIDQRFPHKYRVYEDLRERGLVVRTGFKFGCDYRVYERGVQLKKGPKSAKEHTKWIVFAVSEDFTMSFAELSRAVRLAHNIRAKMLWAVVDNESDCTFYQILRIKP
ncbi:MAG: tRNA-intron lyase [Candidatus Aenigmarchaeota archaeon]|nr:tRNA-intron lyase [Candidatus Aenigmarchaeota archaeon]